MRQCRLCRREITSSPVDLCKVCCSDLIQSVRKSIKHLQTCKEKSVKELKELKEAYKEIEEPPSLSASDVVKLCKEGFVGVKSDWIFLKAGLGLSRYVWVFKPYKRYNVILAGRMFSTLLYEGGDFSASKAYLQAFCQQLSRQNVKVIALSYLGEAGGKALSTLRKAWCTFHLQAVDEEIETNKRLLSLAAVTGINKLRDLVKILGKEGRR